MAVGRSRSATTRNTGISARRMKPIAFGIVHGFSGWSRAVCVGRRPGAVDPEQPPLVIGRARRPSARPAQGSPRHSSAIASAAPSIGTVARLAAPPDLDLDLARRERAAADRDPHRAAEQLGVGELLARARRRARRRASRSPSSLQLGVEPVGERPLLAALACRARPSRRRTARSRAATRSRARRRTARPPPRPRAPARSRSSPSRSAARCRTRRGSSRRAARSSAVPSLKMLPTSIAGSIRIGVPSTVSPCDDRAHVDRLELEVTPGLDATQVDVGPVRPGHVAARPLTRRRRAGSASARRPGR